MTERDKALAGYLFRQGDPVLAEERGRAQRLCFEYNQTSPADTERQNQIMEELIGTKKGNYHFNPPFYCDYGTHISLGNNFFANYNCVILDGAKVTFGDDVRLAPNCTILTPTHVLDPEMRKNGYEIFLPVTIKDNVWLGAGVTVLPGVTIGENSVIGAGSVVTRDIPANVLAAGVPCKVIRELNEEDKCRYPEMPE